MSDQFVGEIKLVGFNFPPRNYATCNGALVGISQNQALFALLSTVFGGNGVQTFGLPDYQGRVPVGQGTGAGLATYVLGQKAGTESVTLLSSQMPLHTHIAATTVTPNSSALAAATTIKSVTGIPPASRLPTPAGNVFTVPVTSGNPVNAFAAPGTGTLAAMDPTAASTALTGQITATASTTLQTAGNSQPTPILQPYLGSNYIIALNGIFPSRN